MAERKLGDMVMRERLIEECEKNSAQIFASIDGIAYKNQVRVLQAFKKFKIALRHFAPTTGYGYDDTGRDTLSEVFAEIFEAEKAIVSPMITSGTHALTLMLFGILRPGDVMLSITGDVYDTFQGVIEGKGTGSLKDFGIKFEKIELEKLRFSLCFFSYPGVFICICFEFPAVNVEMLQINSFCLLYISHDGLKDILTVPRISLLIK